MMDKKSCGVWSCLGAGSLRFIPILALVLFIAGCMANTVVVIPGGKVEVEMDGLVEKMGDLDVVFIGESHQSSRHHRFQIDIIKALWLAEMDIAIGLEMFQADSQRDLDLWVAGGIPRETFKGIYYKNWQVSWSKYEEIFLYARKHEIPIVALNLSRDIVREVFSKDKDDEEGEEGKEAKEDSPAEAEETPVKTDDELGEDQVEFARLVRQRAEYVKELRLIECDADPQYEKFLRAAINEHDGMEMDYDRFCRAQMIWDTTMAKRVAEYIKENPNKVMVVLVGGVHAWKRAMPRKLGLFSGGDELSYMVIVPEMRSVFTRRRATEDDMDYMLLNPWMW
jgi:uncharacterized iron-regulated protein